MLGQVCYKEFYENQESEYKEAFVIFGTHSTISIYYAKLPNEYLANIAQYGVRYLQKSEQHVKLRCTKRYHMRDTAERVELFHILAELLWYLISGRSHVGYLYNYADNPLHKLVYP
jgi:hypothetical protein